MFGRKFSHYLSYGATDQQTLRDLTEYFDGLLVPGTIAAFQREGTGGFVLTLSATKSRPEYVIDPRFPLFQQALSQPKRSHIDLAQVLSAPALVRSLPPEPEDFTPELIRKISASWAEFNGGYQTSSDTKFNKYAKRLQEPVTRDNTAEPLLILPPYLCCQSSTDPWWQVSQDLYEQTTIATPKLRCVRVVASTEPDGLGSLLASVRDDNVAVWVSGLEELTSSPEVLALYLRSLASGRDAGKKLFALYGGFFSVLAANFGLVGSSHGIGYGEYRNWVELPQSGPPPARYYLPRIHRYVSQDFAYRLWLMNPELTECNCHECNGLPPIELEYHSLMKHSVFCRSREIEEWVCLDTATAIQRLVTEHGSFLEDIYRSGLPDFLKDSAHRQASHMPTWVDALQAALDD